ncbi:MAG: hypothetical protein DI527_00545 [Chelatococcus sp.]|nr:MAG: hypothetical protein DI527_00545 [Chelatococcus sp.]
MLSTIHDFLAELGKKPAPLTFAVAVSADMPPGRCSFTRMENGEMKVLWAGRLSEVGEWPAGAKLWLHRDDYDRLCREVPAR